uniref:EF-hand domain-containing protein n=1 Tax=Meloidogyne enterolobii TaxID=390850 RepID=A0A6V7VRE1_MELEN|nr:unnamed protein product [Meloidogyne enterolobii]
MFIYILILFYYFWLSSILSFQINYFNKLSPSEKENNKNILWKDNYLFDLADTNSDGFISFSEYSSAWGARNRLDREQINRVTRLPYLYEHFKQMDIDKDGLLNFNEFIYDINNSRISRKQLGKLFFQAMDENSDETITFDEFLNFVSNIYGYNYNQKITLSNNIEMNSIFFGRDFNKDRVLNLDEFLGIIDKDHYKINKEKEVTTMTTPFDLSELNGTTTTNIFITSEKIDDSTIISESTTINQQVEKEFYQNISTTTTTEAIEFPTNKTSIIPTIPTTIPISSTQPSIINSSNFTLLLPSTTTPTINLLDLLTTSANILLTEQPNTETTLKEITETINSTITPTETTISTNNNISSSILPPISDTTNELPTEMTTNLINLSLASSKMTTNQQALSNSNSTTLPTIFNSSIEPETIFINLTNLSTSLTTSKPESLAESSANTPDYLYFSTSRATEKSNGKEEKSTNSNSNIPDIIPEDWQVIP